MAGSSLIERMLDRLEIRTGDPETIDVVNWVHQQGIMFVEYDAMLNSGWTDEHDKAIAHMCALSDKWMEAIK